MLCQGEPSNVEHASIGRQSNLALFPGVPSKVRRFEFENILDACVTKLDGAQARIVVKALEKRSVVVMTGEVRPERLDHANEWCQMVMSRAYKGAPPATNVMNVPFMPFVRLLHRHQTWSAT